MKVIGAGFGRTGTLSLHRALETLGFTRCYHMQEVMLRRREHAALWLQRARGGAVDWHALFRGYAACVDFPACLYYRELMVAFPDAKVLLSVRDPVAWHDSAMATIYPGSFIPAPLRWIPFMRDIGEAVHTAMWNRGGLFDGRFTDRAHAVEVFERWVREVREHVPAERLLVFDVRAGWEPLCAFLGVPVPDEPFPNVNDRRAAARGVKFMRAVPVLSVIVLAAVVAGAVLSIGAW